MNTRYFETCYLGNKSKAYTECSTDTKWQLLLWPHPAVSHFEGQGSLAIFVEGQGFPVTISSGWKKVQELPASVLNVPFNMQPSSSHVLYRNEIRSSYTPV
jgi:hypothetical protein